MSRAAAATACGCGNHSRAIFHIDRPATTNASQIKAPGTIFQGSSTPRNAPSIHEAGGYKIKRGSPNPQLAHSAQRGKRMPSRHCPATSIHDARWNCKSWPEALPRKNIGAITAEAKTKVTSTAMRTPPILAEEGTASVVTVAEMGHRPRTFDPPRIPDRLRTRHSPFFTKKSPAKLLPSNNDEQ